MALLTIDQLLKKTKGKRMQVIWLNESQPKRMTDAEWAEFKERADMAYLSGSGQKCEAATMPSGQGAPLGADHD